MTNYPKIQTVYKRDPNTKNKTLLEKEYSLPEFKYLANNQWLFTEKIDGTNIHLEFISHNAFSTKVNILGKTEKAKIPKELETFIKESLYITQGDITQESFLVNDFFERDKVYNFFGEGYGAKIQSGGKYSKTQKFILFDININGFWLQRKDVLEIANILNLDVVPLVGMGNLEYMVDMAKKGFKSKLGNFEAEGIVAVPIIPLYTKQGERIITKIKCKDFKK